jgi:hypothetical protein
MLKMLLLFLLVSSAYGADRNENKKIISPGKTTGSKTSGGIIEGGDGRTPVKPIDPVRPVDPIARVPEVVAMKPLISIVTLCGKKFSQVDWGTDHQNFIVETEVIRANNQDYLVPSFIKPVGIKLTKPVGIKFDKKQINLVAPLLPSLPILPMDSENQLCDIIKEIKNDTRSVQKFDTKTVSGSLSSTVLTIELKETSVPVNNESTQNIQQIPGEMVIYYDDLYAPEVQQMAIFFTAKGYATSIQSVSSLPGLNGVVPDQCQGYMNECYYTLGAEAAKYISEDFISTLSGFLSRPKVITKGQKYPYIPGLIRADLRRRQSGGKLKYAMLIGNSKKLAPFYVTEGHHDLGRSRFPTTFIHTDLYYMLPYGELKLSPKLSFDPTLSSLWSCKDVTDGKVRLRKICNDNETRVWTTPPLAAYRDQVYTPQSIAFEYEDYAARRFQDLMLDKMIAIGRIPTHEDIMGGKDPIVKNYLKKLDLWFSNLPSMAGNSFVSHGGTASDVWIFEEADTVNFRAVYGAENKVYASEVFVPMPKCPGCEYKKGEDIFPEIAQKNRRVGWLINGHGAMDGVQAPYALGDISSDYRSENRYRIGGENMRAIKLSYPEHNTLKILENSKTIIGHVFANSCSISNFTFAGRSDLESFFAKTFNSDQRSMAELLIAMPESGAMNTLMNADVGYGGQDNQMNRYFMSGIAEERKKCRGTIGDAYKYAAWVVMRNKRLFFQVHNRQFLGAPVTPIAKSAVDCPTDPKNPKN